MALRISSNSRYTQFLYGLHLNQAKLAHSQEQAALARRIVRPSDDPTGTTTALSISRRIAQSQRYLSAIGGSVSQVDLSASNLQDGAGALSEARETVLQGMNGTLSATDRASLAVEIDLIRTQLLETANSKLGDRYLFGGTQTDSQPFIESLSGGRLRASYVGNSQEQSIRVGSHSAIEVNLPGSTIFAKDERSGMRFAGLTGIAAGVTANQGSGNHYVELRHDSTDLGTLLADTGIGSVGAGGSDTLLGQQSLVIDAANRSVRLGSGELVTLPVAGDPALSSVTVTNELGGELVLDFSAWNDAAWSAQVAGNGSIRLDDGAWKTIDFNASEIRLQDSAGATILHVDPSAVQRSGVELVSFQGTVNVFDNLQAIADDLRNTDGLDTSDLLDRLNMSLDELDRNHENLLSGLGVLGSRSARMSDNEGRLEDGKLQLQSMFANVVDADYSELATQITQTELTLQMVQATAARINQSSLLNFLR